MFGICRVIVGASGSPRNLLALRYAAALAHAHAATLIPVLAWVPPGGEVADRRCPAPWLRQEWKQMARDRLDAAVDLALGGMPADPVTERLVVCGQAGSVLIQVACGEGYLLVIGTSQHGTARRLAGGAVSRYCLAHACRPVPAVPPASLELHARAGLHRWAFRHSVRSASELSARR